MYSVVSRGNIDVVFVLSIDLLQGEMCNRASVNNCLGCVELQDDVFWQQDCGVENHTYTLKNAALWQVFEISSF